MGLGMPPFLAERLATEPTTVSAQGSTRASAYIIGRSQFLISITGSNSGGGLLLPPIGGDTGCDLGDDFIINNQIAPVTIYGVTGTSISIGASNGSGSGGFALASHQSVTLYPITATTWIGLLSA